MKHFFPPQNQNFKYLQTNRSDMLGSLWSTFNVDIQANLGALRLGKKLVNNTTSSDSALIGLPSAFEFFYGQWWAICDTSIFNNNSNLLTNTFSVDVSPYSVGDSTTRFDITNTTGNTYRYTYDGTGTNPSITAAKFPIGSTVYINGNNFNAGNNGVYTVTGSGSGYFEITNGGTAENDKTLGTTGFISVRGGSLETSYQSEVSDFCIFNEKIWSSARSILYSKDEHVSGTYGYGNWTPRDTIVQGPVHKLASFKKTNRLYYTDDYNSISSIDVNNVPANSTGDFYINLNNKNLRIATMEINSDSVWIGTRRMDSPKTSGTLASGTKGCIYQWDGISSQVTKEYKLESAGVLSMCVINDIPYAIDTEGRILKYTGYSFEEIQRLPLNYVLLRYSTSTEIEIMPVHFNGMIGTKNNTILILVNNTNSNELINENLPSGVWELDLSTNNFIHKNPITLQKHTETSVTDYGQNIIYNVGALKINYLSASATGYGRSSLFAGCSYYTDATTVKSAIMIESPSEGTTENEGQKRGYFVTTFFDSNVITSTWLRLWTIYKRFSNATDKMIFKYRLIDIAPLYATITWTSTTTFTTTTNISNYVGFEAEILQGKGSGACTNILTITENAGTYTATIDTAVTGVTGTAKARFQKWIKIGEISNTVLSYGEMPIDVADTTIQIKGILELTGNGEFIKNILVSTEDVLIDS